VTTWRADLLAGAGFQAAACEIEFGRDHAGLAIRGQATEGEFGRGLFRQHRTVGQPEAGKAVRAGQHGLAAGDLVAFDQRTEHAPFGLDPHIAGDVGDQDRSRRHLEQFDRDADAGIGWQHPWIGDPVQFQYRRPVSGILQVIVADLDRGVAGAGEIEPVFSQGGLAQGDEEKQGQEPHDLSLSGIAGGSGLPIC
jgi:hypothetical protein